MTYSTYYSYARFNLYFAPDICLLDFRPAHMASNSKHRRAFAASKSLTVPNSSNYFIILCLLDVGIKKGTKFHFKSPTAERRHVLCVGVGIPDLSMLHQFGESDVQLSSPVIIALVHNASYLEVPLYFCSRTLSLHPFRVDFIHTRIDIFCLLALSFGNRIPRLTRWPQR
jgi:hypothetical protein